jgi:predicted RNA-binding Zn-ribbon protein involved in translation (DUF1610 family)
MKALKISCPSCNLSIEVDRNQSHVGTKCPNCGVGLIPDNIKQAEKIEKQACFFVAFSGVLFPIGILALFAADWWTCVSCIGISLWLYLTGQIVHIRALLAKK